MLKPPTLSTADYAIALKPELGYEEQLFFSTQIPQEVGELLVLGLNSGVYTPNVAENAVLSDVPAELLIMLDSDINVGVNPAVTITGTDSAGSACTGVATIAPPVYAQLQEKVFPRTWAAEVTTTVTAGKKFKTITSLSIVCDADLAGIKLRVFAVPSVDQFVKVGCKTKLDWDPSVPKPLAVQCGRKKAAYIKSGEIDEPKVAVTVKVPGWADGLARINGVNVTGLIKHVKEDKVTVMHTYCLGMILTWKVSNSESVEPTMLNAEGICQETAFIVAQ